MGHVTRCVNLSKNLKNCKINFLVEDFGGVKKFLKNQEIKNIFTIKPNTTSSYDLQETQKIIQQKNIDLLIIDKYSLKLNYCKKIKKNVKVIVLSDLFKIDFPADLIVNGFIGFKIKIKKNKYGAKCLLGPKFQILNKNFEKNKKRSKEYDLLVTFGGFDENDIIGKFLEVLANFLKPIKAKIILGSVTIKTKKIEMLEKICKKYVIIKNQTSNMFNEINSSKFGLCSGGITTYEFAAMRVPFAIICQVRHQILTANEWEKRKIGMNLGIINKKTDKKIQKFLHEITTKDSPYTKSKKIVDGLGTKRVSSEIKKILEKSN